MNRRALLLHIAVALTVPKLTWAQPKRAFRVAYVAPSPGPTPITDAFRRTLDSLGYVEGKNLVIEYRWMAGRESEYPAVVSALAGHVDVALVYGDISIAAAQRIADTTPIVFVNAAEPVALGVVQSLARPGGNMTGITHVEPELVVKRLELLQQMVPETRRFAVIAHPDNASAGLSVHEVEATGRTRGVTIKRFDVARPDDFAAVVGQIAREGFGGVVVVEEPMFFAHRATLVEHLGQHRLPAAYPFRQFVDAGGLMAYAANLAALAARGAAHVAKILGGDTPSNIPVERPTKFELVLNLKTAKALGITVPPIILFQADEVIQ